MSDSVRQAAADGGELVDGVEFSREVVEADRAAALRASSVANTEEAETVMLPRTRQTQEGGVGTWFERDDLHAEQLGVVTQRPDEVWWPRGPAVGIGGVRS